MLTGWGRYLRSAYPWRVQVPLMLLWAIGLTALFARVAVPERRWQPDAGLAVTAVTLVVDMLVLRALDDLRDHDCDRVQHPERALPSGQITEAALRRLVLLGAAAVVLLNAGRGVVLLALLLQLGYAGALAVAELRFGRPSGDRPLLQLALNLPVQTMLSGYVYVGFLRDQHRAPTGPGSVVIVAVTAAGLALELGRKATRTAGGSERGYVDVLGMNGTSLGALAGAVLACALVLLALPAGPWRWWVLLPLALPAAAAVHFGRGGLRWPPRLVRGYLPVLFGSFLLIALSPQGVLS